MKTVAKNLVTFKIDDSVKVKDGITDPDFDDCAIGGWQGRVKEITEGLVQIEWDSITLKQMPEDLIKDCLEDGCDFTSMSLDVSNIELVVPRDEKHIADFTRKEFNRKYVTHDQQEENIAELLATDDLSVNEENLAKYLSHLKNKIELPCLLTGSEDFAWEEPYILGGWDKKEYAELKKTRASYTDIFELVSIDEQADDDFWGLYVNVKRVSDSKKFYLPLWDLKVKDKKDKNFQPLSDYSFWMTNYR